MIIIYVILGIVGVRLWVRYEDKRRIKKQIQEIEYIRYIQNRIDCLDALNRIYKYAEVYNKRVQEYSNNKP